MSVPVAYATILLVWSTTPLGIAWSNETVSPIAAIALRMNIAAFIGFLLLKLMRIDISWTRDAVRTYATSLLGIYGALSCTYVAANYVPSGLISVMYALAPVLSSLFSIRLLGQAAFSRLRWIAFGVSFAGLVVICMDDWAFSEEGWKGVLLLAAAVTLYSLSGVLLQKENYRGHPLSVSVGSLMLAAPLFIATWWLFDGELPHFDAQSKSPWSILYLAICGSLIGFMAYFYIVKELGATAVAMATLATPVMALVLGSALNQEPITLQTVVGTAAVLVGLSLYYQANRFTRLLAVIRR